VSDDGIGAIIPPSDETVLYETRMKMVARWEAAHQVRGVTLTDAKVNTGFRATVEMMDMVVQGMHATGGLTAKQMESLRWWLDTAVAAADEFGS
jgi:hypothetical protein